ncbi:hypothetical protein SAMN05661091_4918 [Paenibacillus uliginis N3/975]|uniref:Uncharacterized protein n=2 Tax=Paenibacillus TaxID=44249 RepID=A0A1X7HQY1_9BACL|nr:hypothetical protein SAMN05661091_4918 [Paenibacillus uliginis N3/975]
MAIEYSLKLERILSDFDLLEQLESMGYIDNDVIELPKGIELSQLEVLLV